MMNWLDLGKYVIPLHFLYDFVYNIIGDIYLLDRTPSHRIG